jgi:sulfoquinovosidase
MAGHGAEEKSPALKEIEMFYMSQQTADCMRDNPSEFLVALAAWVRAQIWDEFDELKTVVERLSRGASGTSLSPGNPNGFITTKLARVPFHSRAMELLIRWTELNAFTAMSWNSERFMSSIGLRCHPDGPVLNYLDRFAQVHKCLAPYRKSLAVEAASTGYPIVRPLSLHYPDDSFVFDIRSQFMLGRDFLIAPVLDKGARTVRVYLPTGNWTHLWTGRRHISAVGDWTDVAAPLGEPGVFFRTGAMPGDLLVLSLMEAGVI